MHFLKRLFPRSLVGRVFALYTVTLIGFVMVGLAAFFYYQTNVALDDEQDRVDALGSIILPTLADSAVIGDYDTILRTLERAVAQSLLASASFIDLHGGVVRAPSKAKAGIVPPQWLETYVATRLLDSNKPLAVGGRDYGVLRMTLASDRVAGRIWEQVRVALLLGLLAIAGGVVLIRFPLVRWLGKLSRVQEFEQAMAVGGNSSALLRSDDAPTEFRETFEVLGRAAASLQSQRAQAAVTLGAIADGVFTLDAEGRIALVNPAACAMVGRAEADLLGQPAHQALPAALLDENTTLTPWQGHRMDLSTGAPNARPLTVDTSLSLIRTPEGAVAGYVLVCRDVTEQHRLDERLRQELQSKESALVSLRKVLEDLPHIGTTGVAASSDDLAAISAMISTLVARLQIRGEQLKAIFELSPDGFISFDAQQRVNYVSPGFSRLTGLSEIQIRGASIVDIEHLLHQQCNPSVRWRDFDHIRHDKAHDNGEESGKRRELLELVRPVRRVLEIGLRESDSNVISLVLSLRDVTHETEVDQMKSEFLSTAAHELRTPMTSIFGFSELLLHRTVSPEQQKQFVKTIHRQSELMISIINELLDLARIESRRGKDFVLEQLDLVSLTQDVIHDYKPPQERQSPAFDTAGLQARVSVDRNKMRQALTNVLSNAYKYSPGGGDVSVRLVHRAAPQRLVGIEIQDHGIGMTPEQLKRVSERFYRADASGTIPGTGLGMSIVKEIVELLGGQLEMSSEFGLGTTVTLWLPALD